MGTTKYFEISKLTFLNSLAYKYDFIASSAFVALIIFILINLWKVVYSTYGSNGLIEGFTINMMIWYLIMSESLSVSPGRVIEKIGDEIQSGEIAQYLNKPYNYILFKFAMNLGTTLLKFVTTLVIGGAVALLFVGGFHFQWQFFPFMLIAIILGLTLNFLMMAAIGVLGLWLEDTRGLNFIYTKLLFVVGGMLLPLDLFPPWLASICSKLPFSHIAYFPSKLFVFFTWEEMKRTIIGQVVWICIIALIVAFAYQFVLKRISINGG